MELEEPTEKFRPIGDQRPRVPEPPPVKLTAIDDLHLEANAGLEKALDAFYIGLLHFERPVADPLSTRSLRQQPEEGTIVYHAENADLVLHVVEKAIEREDFRAVGIEIPHFREFVDTLKSTAVEFEWQKGLVPGQDAILTRDPAGNWVRITPVMKLQ